jgi:hypothetical protein
MVIIAIPALPDADVATWPVSSTVAVISTYAPSAGSG